MLMRHAKSDWADAGLSDHERPLNARGRRDAPEMARWMVENSGIPDLVLASTARRVSETLERMVKQWKTEPPVLRSDSLYLATPQTILEHIRCEAVDPDGKRPKRLLVVGHNPGMEQLVSSLSGVYASMPTAAVAVFECLPITPEDDTAPQITRTLAIGRPKEI
jgi:phosphohistidine phosphatase